MRTAPYSPAWSTRIVRSTSSLGSGSPGSRISPVFIPRPYPVRDARGQHEGEDGRQQGVPAGHREAPHRPGGLVAAHHAGTVKVPLELLGREPARDVAGAG